MNNYKTTTITQVAFNKQYSHCTKLNQGIYCLFVVLHSTNPDIRSTDILFILQTTFSIKVSISWINQKLKHCGCKRPRGRPPKKDHTKRKSIHTPSMLHTSGQMEQIGIPFILDLMQAVGLTERFVSTLQETLRRDTASSFPSSPSALTKLIHTLSVLTLDPRVQNFEEAMRANQIHTPLSISHAARLTKATEGLPELLSDLNTQFATFWADLLGLTDTNQPLICYLDGHGFPYYTKKTFLAGRMSVTERIVPGTHGAMLTMEGGFILGILMQDPNTHLNTAMRQMATEIIPKIKVKVLCIIVDRECNGRELMEELQNTHHLSILTALRKNQYKGLEDFECYWIEKEKFALAEWKDEEKRQADPRFFLITLNEDQELYVQATTSTSDHILAWGDCLQKSRWPFSENVFKTLVHVFDFNMNVGNGTYQVENPKVTQLEREREAKVATYEERLKRISAEKRKRDLSKTRQHQLEKSEKTWKKRKRAVNHKYKKLKSAHVPTVGARKLEPQGLMSFIRIGLYNLLLYLIEGARSDQLGLRIGMEQIKDLLVNRPGRKEIRPDKIVYWFRKPDREVDEKILSAFLEGVNDRNLMDKKGRVILGKVSMGDP